MMMELIISFSFFISDLAYANMALFELQLTCLGLLYETKGKDIPRFIEHRHQYGKSFKN